MILSDSQIFIILFIVLLIVNTLTKLYLSLRNSRFIKQKSSEEVPALFAKVISSKDHIKSAEYSLAKASISRYLLAIDLMILLLWTVGGGVGYLDHFLSLHPYFSEHPLIKSVALLMIFSLINLLLALPEELYTTFILEERFGFNRTTLKLFISDQLKQILIGMIIGIPLFLCFIWVMKSFSLWWPICFAALTSFQLFLIWIYPAFIAPLFNRFTPLPDGEMKDKVEKFLKHNHFPYQGLYVMDASKRSTHGNAYFTGFGRYRRIVFFDTLLQNLTADEVIAVLAHEIAHLRFKHIQKNLLLSISLSAFGLWILGQLSSCEWFYKSFLVESSSHGSAYAALLILFSLIVPAFTFWTTPIAAALSRRDEFAADQFAAKVANASDLISALAKMFKDNASTLTPDPLYALFYYSHPDAITRVMHLQSYVVKNSLKKEK